MHIEKLANFKIICKRCGKEGYLHYHNGKKYLVCLNKECVKNQMAAR